MHILNIFNAVSSIKIAPIKTFAETFTNNGSITDGSNIMRGHLAFYLAFTSQKLWNEFISLSIHSSSITENILTVQTFNVFILNSSQLTFDYVKNNLRNLTLDHLLHITSLQRLLIRFGVTI